MFEQPTKQKEQVVSSSVLLLLILLCFIYFSGHLRVKFTLGEAAIEDIEYERPENWEPPKRKPKLLNFEDFAEKKWGKWRLTEKRKDKLNKHFDRLDNADTYILIALFDGKRECATCFIQYGETHINLKEGEVFKVGVSLRGKSRYNPSFYRELGLEYIAVHTGDYTSCLKKEKELIFFYPISPENLKRDKPLVRPPANTVDN